MDELALEAKKGMEKSINNLRTQLSTLRTGRANAMLLDTIQVDYYGDKIALKDIASITVPEPRQLLIKPYDKNDLKAIVAAINASDIGINPQNEGTLVRLIFPPLTEDRRRELVKLAKKYGEEARIALRNIRRDYIDYIKDSEDYSDDLKRRIEADIQKVTDEMSAEVDAILKEKEQEIMQI